MFGFSFGKNKQTTNETATKNESTTQQQTGTNTTTTSGTSTSTGTTAGSSTGTSTTTQSTTGSQSQTQTGSSFGAGTLNAINQNVGAFIDRILGGNAGGAAISELGSFDPEAFIASTMQAARFQANEQLGESIRGVTSMTGGDASENSATALLANRMENATGASLAGVQANAVKTAQDILTQRSQAMTGAAGTEQNALAQILNAIKGGETTGTSTGVNDQSTTGTTNTSEQNQQTQNQQTQTTQTALEIINQLLQGTTNSTGTSKGTTTKSGGGISLSL